MKSVDCCEFWSHDCCHFYTHDRVDKIKNINYHATNVHAIGNKLYSYKTPICIFENGIFIYTLKNYSQSTSKHQSYMRKSVIKESFKHDLPIPICVYDINDFKNKTGGQQE